MRAKLRSSLLPSCVQYRFKKNSLNYVSEYCLLLLSSKCITLQIDLSVSFFFHLCVNLGMLSEGYSAVLNH